MTQAASAGFGSARRARRFVHHNGLALFFLLAFPGALIGQAFAGLAEFNSQMAAEQLATAGFWEYVSSSDYAVNAIENWQSEYLQFFLYMIATNWLVQRGSPECKELGRHGPEFDEDQMVGEHAREDFPGRAGAGGWRQKIYWHSLLLTVAAIFSLSWLVQSITGVVVYNQMQLRRFQAPLSWGEYLGAADSWNRTLQNWQSEMLAVVSMAVLSIYLRQRAAHLNPRPVGSPRSHGGGGMSAPGAASSHGPGPVRRGTGS